MHPPRSGTDACRQAAALFHRFAPYEDAVPYRFGVYTPRPRPVASVEFLTACFVAALRMTLVQAGWVEMRIPMRVFMVVAGDLVGATLHARPHDPCNAGELSREFSL